ncbi:hypothetical protein UPYG_G00019840 [Umbra pygmaea]|uniref:TFIIS central domain-containing protein n=1 Tax=Umbra pygmaea TaxID=75934 RepID=A0ABD0XMP5_UMBPY
MCASCGHEASHTSFSPERTSISVTERVKDSEGSLSPSCQPNRDSSFGSTSITVSNVSHAPTSEDSIPPQCKDIGESALRSKCIQLLLDALQPETSKEADGKSADLARVIEEHIHALHSENQVKYKACIRSKVSNLRNPKTSHLRQGLLDSSLEPEVFVRMSVEEMASEELQRLRKQYSLWGVSERQLPQRVEGTPTHKLRCRRCEALDCRVTQVSRGTLFLPAWVRQATADQDAMTFVTCSRCGEQWYHSGWICL